VTDRPALYATGKEMLANYKQHTKEKNLKKYTLNCQYQFLCCLQFTHRLRALENSAQHVSSYKS